ncbi:MAG: YadA-like family protein, partial [Luteimonas sp.]
TGDAATLASAQDYADTGDAATLSNAQDYADTGDAATLASAQGYADTGDAATLVTAQDYADAGDTSTLQSANDYTDQRFAAWDQGFNEMRQYMDDRFHQTDDRISRQGAMTAASGQMAMAGAGAGTDGRLAAGVGFQDGRAALAVGYAKKVSNRVRINFGGAFSGSERSAGFGVGVDL